jgi:hypothetical protein
MAQASAAQRWTGIVISVLVTAFMCFDAYMKIALPPMVVENTAKMGFQPNDMPPLGWILLPCLVFYWIPALAGWGALVLTGWLGGAVCVGYRMDLPLFSAVLPPVYFAILMWAGLLLRQPRYRAFFFPA